MSGRTSSLPYWAAAVVAAVVLLAGSSALASSSVLERVGLRAKKPPAKAKQLTSSRPDRAIFTATDIRPGSTGSGRITVANVGRTHFRWLTLSQDRVVNTGIGSALQLQVLDVTTKQCVYPRTYKVTKVGRKRIKVPIQCSTAWGKWKAGASLRNFKLAARRPGAWRAKERHVIEVRWRLLPTSPNSDQGRTASFRLMWRAAQ